MNTDTARITLGSPQDVIAAIPHLLGFHPARSLVALALTGPHVTATLRYDLPPPASAPALAQHLISCLAANRADEVILLGYGTSQTATPVLDAVREALDGLLAIREILRVNAGRWWSLTCASPLCCPPEGSPCDSDASVTAVQFTVLGSAPRPRRADIAAAIVPVTGQQARQMRAAVSRAEADLLPGTRPDQPPAAYLTQVADLMSAPVPLPDGDAARLLVLLGIIRLRDEAWAITDAGDPREQVAFWTDLTRRAPGWRAAAPASLLAYAAACMTGNGALARAAVDRALHAEPRYSLALLLRDMLDSAVPAPQLRLGLTSAGLAELYRRRTSSP